MVNLSNFYSVFCLFVFMNRFWSLFTHFVRSRRAFIPPDKEVDDKTILEMNQQPNGLYEANLESVLFLLENSSLLDSDLSKN